MDNSNRFLIRLEPAPAPGEGVAAFSYRFVAPLTPEGLIDLAGWKDQRALCFVHRIALDGELTHGLLAHRAGGPGGGSWVFDYELGAGDEDKGFWFETHVFAPGAYVALRDAEGEQRTYRVTGVEPA